MTTEKKWTILETRKPCTPLVANYGFNAHPARFFFLPECFFSFHRKAKMSKKVYSKPPLSLKEQAQLLLVRGLRGISTEELIQRLGNISYYRLKGYTYPYQKNDDKDTPFLPNSKWNYIWNDYVFDSKLHKTNSQSFE